MEEENQKIEKKIEALEDEQRKKLKTGKRLRMNMRTELRRRKIRMEKNRSVFACKNRHSFAIEVTCPISHPNGMVYLGIFTTVQVVICSGSSLNSS